MNSSTLCCCISLFHTKMLAPMEQGAFIVKGTFIERVDTADDKPRSRAFTDSLVSYKCDTHSTGDCDVWSDVTTDNDSFKSTDLWSDETTDEEDVESDCEIVEIEDDEDSDSDCETLGMVEDHESSLAAEFAALTEIAKRARAAATHARSLANVAVAQRSSPASTRRPTFPKANKSMEATAIQQPEIVNSTSLYLKNIPNDYSRDMLCNLLDSEGLAGLYDFVYLPIDFKTDSGFGYAFVNFELHENADLAVRLLQGFTGWTVPTRKVLEIRWSSALQGLQQHVERYRNSPVMHKHMPDAYKAILMKGGVRMDFPAPTRRIRPVKPCENGAFVQ